MLSSLNYPARAALFLIAALPIAVIGMPSAQVAHAQDDAASDEEIDKQLAEDLASESKEEEADEQAAESEAGSGKKPKLSLFDLIFRRGGGLAYVIAVMLVVVILFSIERGLALRKIKVIPDTLVADLGKLANEPGGFDPRKAYRACQDHPSAASRIIRAMLLKVGRPHAEVEHAVREASEREASDLYANVRWLNLAAAVAPLLGLLGTVWGMIHAFYDLGHVPSGANKAVFLANGIYVALVTTFAGLSVAIPAATIAHFFEGRIQSLFRQIDELLFGLLPQVERYEGKIRVSRQHLSGDAAGVAEPVRESAAPPPVEPVGG
ncbi:MAG: MotA/TolQ/ExbB proton channel family protein [Pirellulales bacterium]|nr:MotA/TolQ/ExbB proton channel family protein [Pirellulales bacterium]